MRCARKQRTSRESMWERGRPLRVSRPPSRARKTSSLQGDLAARYATWEGNWMTEVTTFSPAPALRLLECSNGAYELMTDIDDQTRLHIQRRQPLRRSAHGTVSAGKNVSHTMLQYWTYCAGHQLRGASESLVPKCHSPAVVRLLASCTKLISLLVSRSTVCDYML
jgi:hypothetical protein